MPHRPPLTATKMAEMYDDEPTKNVAALLWEIARLRSMILRADQIRKMCKTAPSGVPPFLWDLFQEELDAEPCLTDAPTPRKKAILDRMEARARANEKPPRLGSGRR